MTKQILDIKLAGIDPNRLGSEGAAEAVGVDLSHPSPHAVTSEHNVHVMIAKRDAGREVASYQTQSATPATHEPLAGPGHPIAPADRAGDGTSTYATSLTTYCAIHVRAVNEESEDSA